MRGFSLLAVLLAVGAFAVLASDKPAPLRIWITDVSIVSPESLADPARGSVLIEGDHIARIERKASTKPPAGAAVVSAGGACSKKQLLHSM